MENSVQSILNALETRARERGAVDWHQHMEAAEKINALLQGEQDKLAEIEHQLAQARVRFLEDGKSAAYATAMIEATPEYLAAKKQKALIERALETIRLAKKNASLSSDAARSFM